MKNNDMKIIRDRQKYLKEHRKEAENYCFYCGEPLLSHSNNAEDFGLHNDTVGMCCCSDCDKLITLTNRYLSQVLTAKMRGNENARKHNIVLAIENLQELL